jgi:hypothetical protein
VNIQEVAGVLAKIKLGDNREVNKLVIADWADVIGDLDFDDAIEAVVMHRRESGTYLQAAHIRENVRVLNARRERKERVDNPFQVEPWAEPPFDRAAHEAETAKWVEFYKRQKAGAK